MIGRRRTLPWCWPAALLLLLPVGAARSDPAGLLRAAAEADRHLSYTGVRVIQATEGDETTERRVRVWHLAPDRTRTEYLSPDSGTILLECGAAHWLYSAHRGRWRPVAWRPPAPDLELLLRNYRARERGQDRVTGRPVVELSIIPRHAGNPEKRVWIDPTSRMALREEVRNWRGQVVASSRFEQFEIVRELPAALFEPPTPAAVSHPPLELPFPPLLPRYLPPGYQAVRQSGLRRGPGKGVFLLYTDGLGAISLFEFRPEGGRLPWEHEEREEKERQRPHGDRDEPARREDRDEEGPRMHLHRDGSPAHFTRQVGELVCRVMGDIAPDELRRILASLPGNR